jgi:hypothetical protein
MTQLELAKKGGVSFEMKRVAADEGVTPEFIQQGVADGTIVIPSNKKHKITQHCAIGKGTRVKVNANIGTSAESGSKETELEKLRIAIEYKSDTVMDLSTGGDLQAIRRAIIEDSPIPVGTVPIYQAAIGAIKSKGALVNMTADDIFKAIEEHAADGVDFVTVHCGVTRASIERLKNQGRVTDIVSRGGAILLGWILHNNKENPLYEQYDRLLDIAKRHDMTLSLGDGLRPGSIVDATDRAQIEELIILGELVARARAAGVQAMVEGPGHVPLDQIAANVELEKSVCNGAAGHGYRRRIRPHNRRYRRRDSGHGRSRLPVLRHTVRAPGPARNRGRKAGRHGLAHRGPRRRRRQGGPGRPRNRQEDVYGAQEPQLGGAGQTGARPGESALAAQEEHLFRRYLHHVRRHVRHEAGVRIPRQKRREVLELTLTLSPAE